MGVRTKVWGKMAWIVFEGMGRFYDEYIEEEDDETKRGEMREMMIEFMFLIGFVLPCVYCRISYQEFTDPSKPESSGTDIHRMLSLKNGGKQLIYNLHNRVNKKLRDQEREKASSPSEIEKVNQKWREYAPSFEDALKHRFPSVSSKRFWNSLVIFFALIMCDFRPDESCYIYRFFLVIARMLTRAHDKSHEQMAKVYMFALTESLPLWKRDMTLTERIDIVWIIKKYVFSVHEWTFDRTRKSFEDKCKESIVGCTKEIK
jgi:hypothetical protein